MKIWHARKRSKRRDSSETGRETSPNGHGASNIDFLQNHQGFKPKKLSAVYNKVKLFFKKAEHLAKFIHI